jgi:hypothetical protein
MVCFLTLIRPAWEAWDDGRGLALSANCQFSAKCNMIYHPCCHAARYVVRGEIRHAWSPKLCESCFNRVLAAQTSRPGERLQVWISLEKVTNSSPLYDVTTGSTLASSDPVLSRAKMMLLPPSAPHSKQIRTSFICLLKCKDHCALKSPLQSFGSCSP